MERNELIRAFMTLARGVDHLCRDKTQYKFVLGESIVGFNFITKLGSPFYKFFSDIYAHQNHSEAIYKSNIINLDLVSLCAEENFAAITNPFISYCSS